MTSRHQRCGRQYVERIRCWRCRDLRDNELPTARNRRSARRSLKTNGKIFAMLVKDRLVVKLDRRRVDELVEAGVGQRFDPGHGRLQREWLDVESASDDVWLDLATEAETFVAQRGKQTT